jgi:plasmid stability protein
VVKALKARAGENGRGTDAEHRAILIEALARPRRRRLAEVLAEMPNVGLDQDFERVQSNEPAPNVFD